MAGEGVQAQQPDEVKVDPTYEFEAPRFMEFGVPEETTGVPDEWFENKAATELKVDELFSNDTDFTEEAPENNESGQQIKRPERPRKRALGAKVHNQALAASLTSSTISKNDSILNKTAINTSTWAPKLTVPESPMLHTRSRTRGYEPEDSQTSQLRYIASTIVEQAKRRRLNSFYRKKALYCSSGYMPTRSTKPLTEPVDFQFSTDDRFGVPQPPTEEYPPQEPEWTGEPTIPKPFVFYTDYRAKPSEAPAPSPFKSFKEKVLEIQRKTPKRFRTRPRNYVFGGSPEPAYDLSITRPLEFALETSFRSKPSTLLSQEERERIEMENMPKFQARPVNRRVLESDGQLGISRVPKIPLTETEEFQLSTNGRAAIREASFAHEEPVVEQFKARELDASILHGPVKGVHPVALLPLTVPESPCLATKSRPHPPVVIPQPEVFVFKANPVPVYSAPKAVRPRTKKPKVKPSPFQLKTEVRGKEAVSKLTEKLQEEQRKQHDEKLFKAQPMPIYEEPVQHSKSIQVTQPTPFKLATEELGAQHKQKFIAKVQAEMQENIQQTNFRAAPFVQTPAFEPQKSTKALTVIDDFDLNSDVRAGHRQVYEVQKCERNQAAEAVRLKREEEMRIQEEREIKELRKTLVPKAQPIMLGRPIAIKPSSQALTLPVTPKLSTKTRSLAGRDL